MFEQFRFNHYIFNWESTVTSILVVIGADHYLLDAAIAVERNLGYLVERPSKLKTLKLFFFERASFELVLYSRICSWILN